LVLAKFSTADPEPISIIIPALNEAEVIEKAIASALCGLNIEVIVVDGGSTDDTRLLAKGMGVKVIESPAGRAAQMNQGAQAALGKILLFLHADTSLPPGFDTLVRAVLSSVPSQSSRISIAGAFPLKIDADFAKLRWVEWGVNWRSRVLQMPYGDQALFVKAETFSKVGGFPILPIMEDFEMVRRLKPLGKVVIVSDPVITSARRWLKRGVFSATVINQVIVLGYFLGVNPERLRQLYQHGK
jgi:rSAM/selenodomain-associated transferase 2